MIIVVINQPNPLTGTLKPHSDRSLYSNTVIGTLAVWWVGCYIWYSNEGHEPAAAPPSSLFAVPNVTANAHPSNGQCTNLRLFDVALLHSKGLTDASKDGNRRRVQLLADRCVEFRFTLHCASAFVDVQISCSCCTGKLGLVGESWRRRRAAIRRRASAAAATACIWREQSSTHTAATHATAAHVVYTSGHSADAVTQFVGLQCRLRAAICSDRTVHQLPRCSVQRYALCVWACYTRSDPSAMRSDRQTHPLAGRTFHARIQTTV